MNKRTLIRYLLILFAYAAILYPLSVRISRLSWDLSSTRILFNLFPFFGLLAFSILWLHVMSGVFEPFLRKYIDLDRFVRITAMIVLVALIAHPLLLFFAVDFNLDAVFSYGKNYIFLGLIGWMLLITYDIGKLLQKKYNFFVRHWNKILLTSTIGFLLIFFHSISLGSDLQSGALRVVWIFYGVTAILGTIYIYGVKRFMK